MQRDNQYIPVNSNLYMLTEKKNLFTSIQGIIFDKSRHLTDNKNIANQMSNNLDQLIQ